MTPERFSRIDSMLQHRQTDLTVCLEKVHKLHNLAAIVRTCDAVGINEVHAIWADPNVRLSGHTATGSQNWVTVKPHRTIHAAIKVLKSQGMQVIATNLSATAVDFRSIDYTKPTVILMGQEKDGISAEALALADQDVVIPMVGMVQSLNVSVAAALMLYEAQRQREAAGMYQPKTTHIDKLERDRIMFEGGHPIFAKLCRQKNLPYPEIDDAGQIVASEVWWQKVQLSKAAWTEIDDD